MKRNAAGLGDQELWYELPASGGNVGREQVIAHVPNCCNAQQCSSFVCSLPQVVQPYRQENGRQGLIGEALSWRRSA